MKPVYSLFIFSLIALNVSAGVGTDSLLSRWKRVELGAVSLPDSQQVTLLCELAASYARQKPDSARMFARSALSKIGEAGNPRAQMNAYKALTTASYVLGHGVEAYDYSLKVIEFADELGDRESQLYGQCHLGLAYMLQDKVKASIRVFDKYLQMALELQDTVSIARGYLDQSINYDALKSYDTALYYVDECIAVSQDVPKAQVMLAMAHNRKGYILSAMGKFKEALTSHVLSLAVMDSKNNWERAFAYAGMAKAYAGLENFSKSAEYGEKSLSLGLEMGAKWEVKNASEILANMYERAGNYQKAYKYYKLFKAYHDSIFTEDNERTIGALELKQTQLERDVLHHDNQLQSRILNQRNTLLLLMALVAVVLVLLLLVLYFSHQNRKRYNEELAEQRDKLNELNRSKDRILSVLAHDMRSPINSILSILQLMKQEGDHSDVDFRSLFDDVYQRTKTVSASLNSILDWSGRQFRQEEHKPEPLRINEIIEEQIALCRFEANKKDIAIYHSLENVREVLGEREQVRSIVRNLLTNAIKFTDTYGKVRVKYREVDDMLAIDVIDSGVGMTEKVKAGLFKTKGNTTLGTNNEVGTGLGLFISNEYAQMNGGRLEVESSPREGATFSLILKKAYSG